MPWSACEKALAGSLPHLRADAFFACSPSWAIIIVAVIPAVQNRSGCRSSIRSSAVVLEVAHKCSPANGRQHDADEATLLLRDRVFSRLHQSIDPNCGGCTSDDKDVHITITINVADGHCVRPAP